MMIKKILATINQFKERIKTSKTCHDIQADPLKGSLSALKRHKKIIGISSLSILLLSMFWGTFMGTLRSGCAYLTVGSDARGGEAQKIEVEAAPVKYGVMTRRVTASGHARASEFVTIKAETSAKIKEIAFTEGGSVEKDQIILQFENDELKAKVRMAQARLQAAKSQFVRTEKLHQQKFGSSKEYEKDKADFDGAEANLAQLEAELAKTTIKAPFSGTIGLINFNVGSFVTANTELTTLVQANPMKIDFKIPEKFVNDVGAGQTVEIKIESVKNRVFTGTVEAVDSKVDEDTNSLAVRATVSNDTHEIKPGMFTDVSLIIGERNNTPMVDESAINRLGSIEFLWVVHKGKAHRQRVRTGVHENGMVEIVEGVQKGQIIVTTPSKLRMDGQKVRVVNSDAAGVKPSMEDPTAGDVDANDGKDAKKDVSASAKDEKKSEKSSDGKK